MIVLHLLRLVVGTGFVLIHKSRFAGGGIFFDYLPQLVYDYALYAPL